MAEETLEGSRISLANEDGTKLVSIYPKVSGSISDGLRILTLRKMREWSQDELARRAGLQRTHISRIEQGKYAVTLETIQAIAEALDMTVDLIDPKLRDLAPLKSL